MNETTAPSKVVTDVVPTTTSRRPSQNRKMLCKMKKNSKITTSVYQCLCVPYVGNVRALYMLLWILAVVVVNAFLGNAST